ncbi:Aldo/keto reductase [Wolfiporia cocos MD-104 SS10]|uniref:Aldo/keto reductase n=1 Tax=Wolfiporia cocos (strain MD-104) TaxID=742152 RepID=A0A2H3IWT8_WOLCO|nr:Aldo/keto reductase [Wolfiporia cocos MD-104 SS10]
MSPASTYPTLQLGANGPHVSAIGYGAMGIGSFFSYGKTDSDEAFKTLTYAADRGVTFWDTADVYGTSEAALGKWFATTGRRKEIFLATKFGSVDLSGPEIVYEPRSTPSYIRAQLEKSPKALQTDYIDLYYQHRVDPKVPIEVVIEALRPFVESGKVRYLGLNECSIEVLRRAKAVTGVGENLVACQMEYSPFSLEIETAGFVAAARELGVAVVAYSPLGRVHKYKSREDFDADDIRQMMPRFSDENFSKNLALTQTFAEVARKYDAAPGQIALAWILAVHPDFVPIPGTRSVAQLEENAKAAEIRLSEEDVKTLQKAVTEADVVGDRYPPQFTATLMGQCIELSEWKGEE